MSSTAQLDVLRERNKELLSQLRTRREKLTRLSNCSRQSHKRGREDEAEPSSLPPNRAAYAIACGRFGETCVKQTGVQRTVSTPSWTSRHSRGTTEETAPSDLPNDTTRRPQGHKPGAASSTKSCLVNHSKEQVTEEHSATQRDGRSRVTFQSDDSEVLDRQHRLPPLLGYDWIAGVLDSEDSLIERSDEFFDDLHTFRSLNKDECVCGPQPQFSERNQSVLLMPTGKGTPQSNTDTHQCTFSYRINSRLFPVPLHFQECCPVCQADKSSHPHTTAEPAHVRVSIPRSTLLPPYKYKAHRRSSFDPSDSLGLPSHCLSGWSNKCHITVPPPSCLDLRSSLKISNGSQTGELEDLSAPIESGTQISDVSRLVRHNFIRFSPRPLKSTSYPLH